MIFHNVAGTTSEEFSLGIKTKLIKFRTNNGIVEWSNYGGNWNKIQKTKNDSVNPTVDDDVTLGYQVMDCWYNNVSKAYFICEDNTDGAAVWRAIGLTATGSRLLHVDKSRTDSYTADGTQEKPYLTVQAAVNKAETMTPSYSAPVVIRIAPGIYDETVTIKKDGVHLHGTVGQGACWIKASSGPSLVLTNATTASLATFFGNGGYADPMTHYGDLVEDTTHPVDNQFRDLAFGEPGAGAGYCVMILCAGNAIGMCNNEALFMRCHIAQDLFARGADYITIQNDSWVAGTTLAHNISGLWASRCQLGDLTISYNAADDEPSDSHYGLNGSNAYIYGNVVLSGTGKAGYDNLSGLQIIGNLTLSNTSAATMYRGHITGNVVVAEGAQLDLYGTYIKGTSTFTAGAPNTPCTSVGGELVGTITDSGSRLTWSYKGAALVSPATDHAIVRLNGTSGLMQNSVLLLDDSGNLISTSSNMTIRQNTADGSDNRYVCIAGGGLADRAQGANIVVFGNEYGSSQSGCINYVLGNPVTPTDAQHKFYTAAGSIGVSIDNDGKLQVPTVLRAGTTALDIRASTSDGTDNARVTVMGGGDYSETRGAYVSLYGNEHAQTGKIISQVGNVSGADYLWNLRAGTQAMKLTGDTAQLEIGGVLWATLGNLFLLPKTIDGADNKYAVLCGGGDAAITRGSLIQVNGNETGDVGSIQYWLGNATGSRHMFMKGDGTEAMRLTGDNGRLGIGTNAPGYPLHVKSDTTPQIVAEHAASTNKINHWAESGFVYSGTYQSIPYRFFTSGATRMTIGAGGTVGIGVAPSTSRLLNIAPPSVLTPVEAESHGVYVIPTLSVPTNNGAYDLAGYVADVWGRIATGKTSTGTLSGVYVRAYRGVDTLDLGRFTNVCGAKILFGHNSSTASLTTNAYGIYLYPYFQGGTIDYQYDIYAESGATGGTVTNQYGVYILGNSKKHLLQGYAAIGSATPTTSQRLLINETATATAVGAEFTVNMDSASSGTRYAQTLILYSNPKVTNTSSESGFTCPLNVYAMRGYRGAEDGTLSELRGGFIEYGHYGANVSGPTTTITGLYLLPVSQGSGVDTNKIGTMRDIFINASYSGQPVANRIGIDFGTSFGNYVTSGSSNGAYYLTGINHWGFTQVASGKTNSGYNIGGAFFTVRTGGANDAGTQSGEIGSLWVGYGHYGSGVGSTTGNVIGLRLYPYYVSGTISNMYDIYAYDGSTGGTVTNRWGLYILGSAKKSLLEGSLMVGSTTAPAYPLHVIASNTSNHIVAESAAGVKAGVWADASYSYAGAISDHDFVIKGSATGTKATWISAISRPYIKIVGDTLAGNSYPTEQGSIILRPGASNGNYNKISFRTGSDYEVFYMDYAGRFHFGTNLPAPSWLTPRARITVQDCTDDVQSAGAIYAFGKVDAAGTAARYNNGITGGVTGSIVPGYTNDTDWVGITGFYSRTGGVGVDTGTLTRASCIVASASPQAYAITTNLYMFKTYYYIYSGTNSVANCYDFYGAKYNIEAAVTNKWGIVIDCDDATPKKSIIRGLVGIGNSTMTNPSYPLHVKSATSPQIVAESTAGIRAALWADASNAYVGSNSAHPVYVMPGTTSTHNQVVAVTGGGDGTQATGARILAFGNSYGGDWSGAANIQLGNVTGARFVIHNGSSVQCAAMSNTGNWLFDSSGAGLVPSDGWRIQAIARMTNTRTVGIYGASVNTSAGTGDSVGVWGTCLAKLTVASVSNYHVGVWGELARDTGDSNTLVDGTGVLGRISSQGGGTQAITNAACFRSRYDWGSGTITNSFDFYGDNISGAGTITNKWGLYILGTKNNYFAAGNIGLGINTFGTSADKILGIGTGTAPSTSPADCFQMYSKDENTVAGKACWHERTEGGTEVWHGEGVRGAKTWLTPEGGIAVLLTAGEALAAGEVVYSKQATSDDDKVWKNPIDGDMPIGVVYAAQGTAGQPVWVVVAGTADVLPESTVTATKGYVIYSGATTAGRVDESATVPAAATHFKEVGHWLYTGSGAGVATKAVLHFN